MMNSPVAPFSHLATLWIQVTGTWCNLQCIHCINASGPKDPWLKSLDTETVKGFINEAEKNDRIRRQGAFAKALRAIELLHTRGLLPILTATEVLQGELPAGSSMYERFRN